MLLVIDQFFIFSYFCYKRSILLLGCLVEGKRFSSMLEEVESILVKMLEGINELTQLPITHIKVKFVDLNLQGNVVSHVLSKGLSSHSCQGNTSHYFSFIVRYFSCFLEFFSWR